MANAVAMARLAELVAERDAAERDAAEPAPAPAAESMVVRAHAVRPGMVDLHGMVVAHVVAAAGVVSITYREPGSDHIHATAIPADTLLTFAAP